MEELTPLALNVGRKGIGLETARNNHQIPILMEDQAMLIHQAQVLASSVARLDIGHETAPSKKTIPVRPTNELQMLSKAHIARNINRICS